MSAHCVLTMLTALSLWALPSSAETWVDDSFEDFADGTLGESGQNIYVARDGSVRTIHRFDINHDGWIDLLLNCTHDLIGILPSTAAWLTPDGGTAHAPLAVEGASAVATGDLNKDGYTDLVFCPNRNGVQSDRRIVQVIYGGPDGWPASRSNGILPASNATAVAICNLNADNWPDIAVLNGKAWLPKQGDGQIVRVFFGGASGFLLNNYRDFGIPNAIAVRAADFDANGWADLAVLKTDRSIEIVWATQGTDQLILETAMIPLPGEGAQCMTIADVDSDSQPECIVGTSSGQLFVAGCKPSREIREPISLKAFESSHIAAGDLDGDGSCDLVLTQVAIARASGGEATGADKSREAHVRVLWGDHGAFDAARMTELRAPYATASAIGDLNRDGHADLAVAVYQGAESFSTNAALFPGNGTREFRQSDLTVPVSGATDVAIVPAENELPARTVFCNSAGGTVNERVPSYLYYNGPNGFSVDNRVLIPFVSGYEASAADLNLDGWTDIIAMCSGHLGPGAESLVELGANIFYGTRDGIDLKTKPTVLREYNLYSSNVADLNKDGYLDLVLGAFDPPKPGEKDLLVIYYGGKDGYSTERRTAISSEGRSSICVIADFDRDAWLDIAVTCYGKDLVRIFHGGKDGFSESLQSQLVAPQPIEMETADLNADGFLDLIVGSYNDKVTGDFDTGSLIFWGSADGFHEWNAQWLPGSAPVGTTVADWDGDGHLDIFASHYHGNRTRENLPSYIYWGSERGFDTRDRTTLICDSPSDGLAADFDKDGKLDLAVSCHTRDGNHSADSKVYYNDGNRFANPRVTLLPAVGPHWMWTEDMGNIYNRHWEESYVSSVMSWDAARSKGNVTLDADVPQGTAIAIEIRSAPNADALNGAPWRAIDASGAFRVDAADRAFQYRVTFHSDNGDRYPVLSRVSMDITP
ncbi:MAG: VCBS repeat-containing protein [Candidatus Hydrogenedentes bacterium]|nr:VCBS repeat-containing protein [Candidatus Hydrogenedentota bacterium]